MIEQMRDSATGLVRVTFHWSDEHGQCYDCGLPAAYLVGSPTYSQSLCSVCTALAVWEGDNILDYLFREPQGGTNAPQDDTEQTR